MSRVLALYNINNTVVPAIVHSAEDSLGVEHLVEFVSKLPCAWPRMNGLLRCMSVEVLLDSLEFTRSVVDSPASTMFGVLKLTDSMTFYATSNTPGFLTVSRESVDYVVQSSSSVKLGDAFLLVASHPFTHGETNGVVTALVGVVPWFDSSSVFNGTLRVPMHSVIRNVSTHLLTLQENISISRCERLLPLLPLPEVKAESVEPSTMRKMLSFLLRWHQTRTALHPTLVKFGLSSLDRANIAKATRELKLDVRKWRVCQQRSLLWNRSFVFFGDASPRKALFQSPDCWSAMIAVLQSFSVAPYANFLIGEFLDVLRFIIHEEVMVKGELGVYQFAREFLKPMCDGISAAYIASLGRMQAELASKLPDETSAAKKIARILTDDSKRQLDNATRESLDMRVETLGELRARIISSPDDKTNLRECDLEFLANDDDNTIDVGAIEADAQREAIVEDLKHNLVVVSYNFFCGTQPLMDIFNLPELCEKAPNYSGVMRHGRKYIKFGTVIEAAVLVTRSFLSAHSHLECNGVTMSPLEEAFSKASPRAGGCYPIEEHSKEFDDISIGTDDFVAARAIYSSTQIRDFLALTTSSLPLPVQFNMVANRGLLVQSWQIERTITRAGALRSVTNGAVEVHRLALHTVCHRDSCYKPRGDGATASRTSKRPHISVCYDTGGDTGTRFDRLLQMEAEVPPLSRADLDAAVASLVAGNREKLDAIEDVVSNMYQNNALPLCVRALALPVERNVGYMKNDDRTRFYRLMRSFEAPHVTFETILRFLIKSMPSSKVRELYNEATAGWERMAESNHKKSSDGYARAMREHSGPITDDEASAATTCAPSCKTTIEKRVCPFTYPDSILKKLLLESGVDEAGAAEILDHFGNAGLQCKLHFKLSRLAETRATEAFSDFTRDVFFKHPNQFMLAAADHLLRHKESLEPVKEEEREVLWEE